MDPIQILSLIASVATIVLLVQLMKKLDPLVAVSGQLSGVITSAQSVFGKAR